MEAHYRTHDGRLVVKVAGENQKELFRALAAAQDVFEAEVRCGCCSSRAIRFQTRTSESFEYFSLVCECGAQFQFGQRKDGETLFPKRKDEHGQLLPDRGWKVWR